MMKACFAILTGLALASIALASNDIARSIDPLADEGLAVGPLVDEGGLAVGPLVDEGGLAVDPLEDGPALANRPRW